MSCSVQYDDYTDTNIRSGGLKEKVVTLSPNSYSDRKIALFKERFYLRHRTIKGSERHYHVG